MEALILRRNYPVPVTFADLRRAFFTACDLFATGDEVRPRVVWHDALKEATKATDDVYAAHGGREVHVARVSSQQDVTLMGACVGVRLTQVYDLLEVADEQGYWERPHEVRVDLQERIPSIKAIGEVVQRSLVEAEVRRGH